jgi:hypothetical protein
METQTPGEELDIESAMRVIEDSKREKSRKCAAEIESVLKRYGCRMSPVIVIRGRDINSTIEITHD